MVLLFDQPLFRSSLCSGLNLVGVGVKIQDNLPPDAFLFPVEIRAKQLLMGTALASPPPRSGWPTTLRTRRSDWTVACTVGPWFDHHL